MNQEYWLRTIKIAKINSVKRITRCAQIMGRSESENLSAAQIFYPCMQASDIFHLKVDIAQLGMDQRKVNVLAREIAEKIGYKKPIAIHHHMLMSLNPPLNVKGDKKERTIEMKMSKSVPDSAIFMTDSYDDIQRKISRAYCPEGIVEDNPVLEYVRYILFGRLDKIAIERDSKYGGKVEYSSYKDLEKDYVKKVLHPVDLKKAVIEALNNLIEPIREHFNSNPEARKLKLLVESYETTR